MNATYRIEYTDDSDKPYMVDVCTPHMSIVVNHTVTPCQHACESLKVTRLDSDTECVLCWLAPILKK